MTYTDREALNYEACPQCGALAGEQCNPWCINHIEEKEPFQ